MDVGKDIRKLKSITFGFGDLFYFVKIMLCVDRAFKSGEYPERIARSLSSERILPIFELLVEAVFYGEGIDSAEFKDAVDTLISIGLQPKMSEPVLRQCVGRITDDVLRVVPHLSYIPKNDIQVSFTELGELVLVFWDEING